MDVNAILKCVKSGELELEEAEELLKKLPYEDLGYAKIDHHRKVRQGFEEVIYCQGKEIPHLTGICSRGSVKGFNSFWRRREVSLHCRISKELWRFLISLRKMEPDISLWNIWKEWM